MGKWHQNDKCCQFFLFCISLISKLHPWQLYGVWKGLEREGGREERRLSTTALGGAPNGSVEGKVRERAVFLDVLLLTVQRGQLSLFFNSQILFWFYISLSKLTPSSGLERKQIPCHFVKAYDPIMSHLLFIKMQDYERPPRSSRFITTNFGLSICCDSWQIWRSRVLKIRQQP